MSIYLRALGAAFVSAGVLAVPTAALADTPTDPARVVALVERDDTGKSRVYPIRQGEEIPVVIGVADVGTAPTKAVVNIRVLNDLNLPKAFDNCWYYEWTNVEGAWCEFDQELAVGATYEAAQFRVAAAADAKAGRLPAIVHGWFTQAWAQEAGGIEALAKSDSLPGTTPVKGTRSTLRLEPKALTVPPDAVWVGFAYVTLVTPSTPPPSTPTGKPSASVSTSPSASASPSVSATPSAGGAGGSADGGGLPVTGAKAATVAGGGAGLLIVGLVAFLLARRRRTRFVA